MAELQSDYAGMDTSDFDFPANTATTGLVESGWLDYGQIGPAGDADWFRVNLSAGVTYKFQVEAGTINGLFDANLALYSAGSTLLAQATTGQGFQSKWVEYAPASAGTYYLAVSGGAGLTGSYKLYVVDGATASATDSNPVNGTAGNDVLANTAGNDAFDGGAGVDTAVFAGARSGYTLTQTATGFSISGAATGTDTLANVERLQFADAKLALDLAGNAGTTAKILGAVFGVDSLANESYVGIGLYYLDGGMSYADLMRLALDARLGPGYSVADEVRLIYHNLIGIQPSADDIAYWEGTVAADQFTPESLAVFAADHELNTAHINLTGLAGTGIEYA